MISPKVSVILPVYNGGKYLYQAISSILNQSHKNFELIIINDGSSDDSEKIILSIEDERVNYIKNEINLGLVQTLNKGFSIASGSFIARMDQDDIAHPERFHEQVQFLSKLNEPAIVGSNIIIINEKNTITKIPRGVAITAEENFWVKFRKCPIHHPTVMMSKEITNQYTPFYDISAKHIEDYTAWIKINQRYPIYNIKKALLFYRMHESNTSKIYNTSQISTILKILRDAYLEAIGKTISDTSLKSLLFLSLDDSTKAKKIFYEIDDIKKTFIEKYKNTKFINNDSAYSILSMGMKSNIQNLLFSIKFTISQMGLLSLIRALNKIFIEAFYGYVIIYVYRLRFSIFLRKNTGK